VISEQPGDDLLVGDRYYILAASVAADLPKLVLKHDEAFLVADRRGDVPGLPGSEFGFYVAGTRFLRQLELRVHNHRPLLLNATVGDETVQGAIDLTNPDIVGGDGIVLPGRTLRLARCFALYESRLFQTLRVESFAPGLHELTLSWRFGADFVDVFEVRGHPRAHRGVDLEPQIEDRWVALRYRGLDGVVRTTRVDFEPTPTQIEAGVARYVLPLPPGARVDFSLSITAGLEERVDPPALTFEDAVNRRRCVVERFEREAARIQTDNRPFSAWLGQAGRDVHLLLTETPAGPIPYAGIPWYVAPFGRDSLITALQVLPFEPEIARGTLRFLAQHQGTVDDVFTDQLPGKILHEHRQGEMAACREIPFIPYYGSVDATPLFVILLAEYARWTGDLDLVRELWPAAARALAWMRRTGADERGYLRYARRSPVGLDHQGWKDSHDAIMHASGELARPPIALVEAQGYFYAALRGAAAVAEALGQGVAALELREAARSLRERFEADFWLEDEGFYALALDGAGDPCRVISSNPGHCLWTGIASEARAGMIVRRLMGDDVFSGWGLRTLSRRERLYNPMSYHNGSVWPHDTALTAIGMAHYGYVEPFLALSTGLFQAALHFENSRMPELFCGFPRLPGHGPTRYPVACSPQAWSAGTGFQLVAGMLGLVPDAGENRLTLHRPRLPLWLGWLEIEGLRIAKSRISLRATQGKESAAVEILSRDGDAEIVVRG
jgi:glycogen debranching enzyme